MTYDRLRRENVTVPAAFADAEWSAQRSAGPPLVRALLVTPSRQPARMSPLVSPMRAQHPAACHDDGGAWCVIAL